MRPVSRTAVKAPVYCLTVGIISSSGWSSSSPDTTSSPLSFPVATPLPSPKASTPSIRNGHAVSPTQEFRILRPLLHPRDTACGTLKTYKTYNIIIHKTNVRKQIFKAFPVARGTCVTYPLPGIHSTPLSWPPWHSSRQLSMSTSWYLSCLPRKSSSCGCTWLVPAFEVCV